MGRPRIGTMVLDGLVQGPVPPTDDGPERLREWVRFARSLGLPFDLAIDGDSFSLLPEGDPLPSPPHDRLQGKVQQVLDQLLEVLPGDLRGQVFSTIRGVEAVEGGQVQSIYAVTPMGVEVREREAAGPRGDVRPDSGGRPRLPLRIIVGAGVVVLALGMSPLVVDYRALWRTWTTQNRLWTTESIECDAAGIERYVAVEKERVAANGTILILVLHRQPGFPLDLESFQSEEKRAIDSGSLPDLISVRRLVVLGALSVAYLDEEGALLGSGQIDVRELLHREQARVQIPLRVHPGWTRMRLGY